MLTIPLSHNVNTAWQTSPFNSVNTCSGGWRCFLDRTSAQVMEVGVKTSNCHRIYSDGTQKISLNLRRNHGVWRLWWAPLSHPLYSTQVNVIQDEWPLTTVLVRHQGQPFIAGVTQWWKIYDRVGLGHWNVTETAFQLPIVVSEWSPQTLGLIPHQSIFRYRYRQTDELECDIQKI